MNHTNKRTPMLERQAMKHVTHDDAVTAFLGAAATLLESAFEQARKEDAAGVAGLMQAMRAGAMVTLRSTFASSTGLAQIAVEVTEPSGETHQLMSCELNRMVAQ